ncbi:MAG: inositol monophosphatase family protein [Thermodesulfobacteriota bacterium]
MDLEHVKRVGIRAAYRSGRILHERLGRITRIRKKGAIDLVTEADLESEKVIIDVIKADFPDHSVLAEETGRADGREDCRWIIDPLDGTTNFAHQLGLFAVSIAFEYRGDLVMGVVLNPVSGELFTGLKGKGAELNGCGIHVSDAPAVAESLLVTGFPYSLKTILKPLMVRFENCLAAARGVRRLGSAALDLCYVACGRFDGFWEQQLKPWDTSAGVVIAREAGAAITDFANQPFTMESQELLATNGRIHREMISLLELQQLT